MSGRRTLDLRLSRGSSLPMPNAKLTEDERFSLALLLELEEDFPGCLDEMAAHLPARSELRRFLAKVMEPLTRKDAAA